MKRAFAAALLGIVMGGAAHAQSQREAEFQALLKQGFALHQQAHFEDALAVLERAWQLEPGDYFANLLLGIDLLRIGKAEAAIPRLEQAARTRPGEEIPEEYLGEAEARLGRYARAAEAYQKAIQRGHGSEEALETWAEFAMERFRQIGVRLRAMDAGVATVRRLMKEAASPVESLVCRGSIPALEQKMALHPAGAQDAQGLATAYQLSICYAVEAGKAAEALRTGAEDQAALHRLRGDVLLRLKGDAAAAQQEYDQAIALRPGDPALRERLAEAQFTAGEPEAARQSAMAALAIDPHRHGAMRTLISLAMDSRDYEAALPWLQRLAAEAPADQAVQVEFGKALAQTGKEQAALQHLAPALAAGYPDEKGALHALEARVLRKLGRDAEAEKAAAEARKLSDAFQAKSRNSDDGKSDVPE